MYLVLSYHLQVLDRLRDLLCPAALSRRQPLGLLAAEVALGVAQVQQVRVRLREVRLGGLEGGDLELVREREVEGRKE